MSFWLERNFGIDQRGRDGGDFATQQAGDPLKPM